MNYIDIAVVVIILGMGFISYWKGFVRACLSFLPAAGALAGSYFTYPYLSKFLRGSFIYRNIVESVRSKLALETVLNNSIYSTQSDLINSLNAPDFIKDSLINNNNSVVYDILDVNGIEDYIAGYIANISVNIISMILAFIVIFIVIRLIIKALDIVSDLPVLSFFNKSCGFAVGIIKGTVTVWLIGIVLTFFYYNEAFANFFEMLGSSTLALFMYENNYLLFMILKIFA
ncbi:MAG: hypothetical protein E7235_03775 [Lachnospiraceae bacterium]|nr:hypothetical protein [Lachnospiraceae bacterium]